MSNSKIDTLKNSNEGRKSPERVREDMAARLAADLTISKPVYDVNKSRNYPTQLREREIKITESDAWNIEELVKVHQAKGQRKVEKYKTLEEDDIKVLKGGVLRQTQRLNLYEYEFSQEDKSYGYCVVRFIFDVGASTPVHSHHHFCNSNILRGAVTEARFKVVGDEAFFESAEIRRAGNFSSLFPVMGSPLKTDELNSDTHAIINFGNGIEFSAQQNKKAILEHEYPVSKDVVRYLNDIEIREKIKVGAERSELQANLDGYNDHTAKIVRDALADIKEGDSFSKEVVRKNFLEGLLRRDTNKAYFTDGTKPNDIGGSSNNGGWIARAAVEAKESENLADLLQPNEKLKWTERPVNLSTGLNYR
jgi:hypothetical protein